MKVDAFVNKKQYAEAIATIKEGIQVAEQKEEPETAFSWKDQLLDIYKKAGNHLNKASLAEELFFISENPVKYYQLLKSEIPKSKWADYARSLITYLEHRDEGCENEILGQLFIEEKYWDRLLELVEMGDLDQLAEYEDHLKPRFPEKIRDLYIRFLREYAKDNKGQEHYQFVASILIQLRSYPDGDKAVSLLLDEFREKYKSRKAMMKELMNV